MADRARVAELLDHLDAAIAAAVIAREVLESARAALAETPPASDEREVT